MRAFLTFGWLWMFLVIASPLAWASGTIEVRPSNDPNLPLSIHVSGNLIDAFGKPITSTTGLTFALFEEQEGGAPLWTETQNILPDQNGNYITSLGLEHSEGLGPELFFSWRARWLDIQVLLPDATKNPRIGLFAVPYAFKASDTDTFGGKPLSAFVLAESKNPPEDLTDIKNQNNSATAADVSPIVAFPTSTQAIMAPQDSGVIALQVRGNGQTNPFEIYTGNNSATPKSYFNAQGALVSNAAPIFSSFASGSLLFAGGTGQLSEDGSINWDWDSKGLRVGPPFSAFAKGTITYRYDASLNHFLAKDSTKDFVMQVGNQDGSLRHSVAQLVTQEDIHLSGIRGSVVAQAPQALHTGAGKTLYLVATEPYIEHYGTGQVSNLIAERPFVSFGSYEPLSAAGSVENLEVIQTGLDISGINPVENVFSLHVQSPTKSGTGTINNNYGIKIEDQTIGDNRWALMTGRGKVEFGDMTVVKKSFAAGQVIIPAGRGRAVIDSSQGNSFKIILSASVGSAIITNGTIGQVITLLICQDEAGNRQFNWPPNLKLSMAGYSVSSEPRKCDAWTGIFDGETWYETSRSPSL